MGFVNQEGRLNVSFFREQDFICVGLSLNLEKLACGPNNLCYAYDLAHRDDFCTKILGTHSHLRSSHVQARFQLTAANQVPLDKAEEDFTYLKDVLNIESEATGEESGAAISAPAKTGEYEDGVKSDEQEGVAKHDEWAPVTMPANYKKYTAKHNEWTSAPMPADDKKNANWNYLSVGFKRQKHPLGHRDGDWMPSYDDDNEEFDQDAPDFIDGNRAWKATTLNTKPVNAEEKNTVEHGQGWGGLNGDGDNSSHW